MFSLLAGFLITRDDIGGWWIWMHYIDINMFSLEVLMINEFDGLNLHCSGHEWVQVPVGNFTKEYCSITTGTQYLDSVRLHHHDPEADSVVARC
jgi:ABC-type multidrug transport system permease subunit